MDQMTPNLSMERTARGKPWSDAHVKRFGSQIERERNG